MRCSMMMLILAAGLPAVAIAQGAGAQAAKPALYTDAQANAGAAVYAQSCAACHGSQLEGVAAPALKGPAFGDMANAQSLTADALLDVIANTMPQSDPGSLKPEELCRGDRLYPAAERLSRRHHRAGQGRGGPERRQDHAVSRSPVRRTTMKKSAIAVLAAACSAAVRQRAGASRKRRRRSAPVAAAAPGEAAPSDGAVSRPNPGSFQIQPVTQKVDVTDAMMLESDQSDDWILHGRTYDNQRFSPFTQINAANVRQLRPTAIIQTGVTKTIENDADRGGRRAVSGNRRQPGPGL